MTTKYENMKYDNVSLDGKVGFIEKTHTYEMIDDPSIAFNSVTTIIKDFHEEFDADAVIEKIINDPKSPYYQGDPEEIKKKWQEKAFKASSEGTILHAYGEALLNEQKVKNPPLPLTKSIWVPEIVEDIKNKGYEVAKTELLVYSPEIYLAGQSDIILNKNGKFMIYDWKFLGKPIQRRGYYNPKTKKYAKMYRPFQHLNDCNWIHYSIQLAIYQTLTGAPQDVLEKVLICVYDDGWEYVPTYPMRVFWNQDHELNAVYETWNGKVYDSRVDKLLNKWPEDVPGR
jgi:hypothetical protein